MVKYKVKFLDVTDKDRVEFTSSLGSSEMLNGRKKIVVKDIDNNEGSLYLQNDLIKKLGKNYIKSHVILCYNKTLEDWFVKLSQNDYYNDLSRNPEKEIKVEFCGVQKGTGREIYRDTETKRYYLRECHYPKEDFAKWFVCGTKNPDSLNDVGDEPRANLIFVCERKKERVRYDDWNGVCAYSDTFNKYFNF